MLAEKKEITECLKKRGVEVVEFNLNYSQGLLEKPISEYIPNIIVELTDNCVDKGAKKITVSITDTYLRVEDDVIEKEPDKSIRILQKILRDGKITTTKDEERKKNRKTPNGGVGISRIVLGYLGDWGGNLNYFVVDNDKIVAEIVW